MRLPHVRFTVRRMMVEIAVLAIVLGCTIEAIRAKRRRDVFLNKAQAHARDEQFNLVMVRSARQQATLAESDLKWLESVSLDPGRAEPLEWPYSDPALRQRLEALSWPRAEMERVRGNAAWHRDRAARHAEMTAYHSTLKRKYLRAAAGPWWSVESDPPPPDDRARGRFWAERGEYGRALAAYEEAIRSNPGDSVALNGLAWLLATCPEARLRDGRRAVELAFLAYGSSSGMDAAYLDTLAAAHAETGYFGAAADFQRKAMRMLPPGDSELVPYSIRLKSYEGNKPYREGSDKEG
jgi:tetratricopeptide (TPR) repeat protein